MLQPHIDRKNTSSPVRRIDRVTSVSLTVFHHANVIGETHDNRMRTRTPTRAFSTTATAVTRGSRVILRGAKRRSLQGEVSSRRVRSARWRSLAESILPTFSTAARLASCTDIPCGYPQENATVSNEDTNRNRRQSVDRPRRRGHAGEHDRLRRLVDRAAQ
jgi:hypothetical protein